MLDLIKKFSALYFTEILSFCLMGNHLYLLVKMIPEDRFPDDEIQKRYEVFYGVSRDFAKSQILYLQEKLSSLSEFVREIKASFARYYNQRHNRRSYFWGDRLKSVIVDKGETLVNCLSYIDLNPVRAGLVDRPANYRGNSLGYHLQTKNKDQFLSTNFGLEEFNPPPADKCLKSQKEGIRRYRRYVYEAGAIDRPDKMQAGSLILRLSQKNVKRSLK